MFAAALTTITLPDLHWRDRAVALGLAGGPLAVVAALHFWRHAAWLRMAGASGAVSALTLDAAGLVLTGLALAGALLAITRRRCWRRWRWPAWPRPPRVRLETPWPGRCARPAS